MGGEADAVAPFEAHLHVAHVRPRLAQRGHQPTSAEHFVGARGHLVDEHDDARCARRAAWLRSCAICPTSWRGLAYVSSEFARTWNAIESTTIRRTLRPGRPGALFACLCVPATRRKRDVQASPPIAHGEWQPVIDRMTNHIIKTEGQLVSSESEAASGTRPPRVSWKARGTRWLNRTGWRGLQMRPSGSTAWNAATGICPSLSHTLATGRTLSRCLRSLERSAFCVPSHGERPPTARASSR